MLASRSPLFLVHLFSSLVLPEGYFSWMLPLKAPYSMSVPSKPAVSTSPVPGFPSKELKPYGWMGTHSSSLPPCSPIWRALLCHMGGENTRHPSSDDLPTPKKLCFPLSIHSDMMHMQHHTATFTFIVLFPDQSIYVYTRILLIVNIGVIFGWGLLL